MLGDELSPSPRLPWHEAHSRANTSAPRGAFFAPALRPLSVAPSGVAVQAATATAAVVVRKLRQRIRRRMNERPLFSKQSRPRCRGTSARRRPGFYGAGLRPSNRGALAHRPEDPLRTESLCYPSRVQRSTLFPLVLAALACSPKEPPSWPQGGAALAISPARWERGEDDPIEIRANGQVVEDGDLLFVVDRAGRIVDAEHDPLGILLPDGRIVGTDDRVLGQVGVTNAAPPWSANAWIAVKPDGTVTHFGSDGDREALGRWEGCHGAALRTCTLVSHLVALREYNPTPEPGIGIGIGIGIGF